MTACLNFLLWLHVQIIGILDSMSFTVGTNSVSFWEVILGFLFLFMIIAVFWKGARG